ncbi:MAG: prepilin-type N-terminal cleavage/methylation domain-containing protein [Nitrospirae bacterium]|nr:prepilin-type N-terminal cleavage/methylation domain-containing protein [Nitrospirota bacterium]
MRGFTLLEVLVAVVLFSVISLVLYNSFSLSDRAIRSVDGYVERLQEGRETLDALRREIESSFFTANKDLGRFKAIDRDVAGRQTSALVFTTFAAGGPGYGVVVYYVDEAGKEDTGDTKDAKDTGNDRDSVANGAGKGGLSGFSPPNVDTGKRLSLYKMVQPNPMKKDTVVVEAVEDVKAFSIEVSDAGNNGVGNKAGIDNGGGNTGVKTWDTAVTGKMPVSVKITLTMALKDGDVPFTVTAYPKIVMDK